MCQDNGTAYLVVINGKGQHDGKLVDEARGLLREWKVPVAKQVIAHRLQFINAMTTGKTGPEKDRDAAAEINSSVGRGEGGRAQGGEGAVGMSEFSTVDSFASLFPGGRPGELQREARKARIKAERRTQLTEKQRRRGGNAVRTTQMNFRRSPAFRELAAGVAKHLECSIADVMEEALEMLASAKGYTKGRGKHDGGGHRRAGAGGQSGAAILSFVVSGRSRRRVARHVGGAADDRPCRGPCRRPVAVGVAWEEGRRVLGVCLVVALVAGEAWALLQRASARSRTVISTRRRCAPPPTRGRKPHERVNAAEARLPPSARRRGFAGPKRQGGADAAVVAKAAEKGSSRELPPAPAGAGRCGRGRGCRRARRDRRRSAPPPRAS